MRDCQTNGRVTAVFDIAEQQASLLCLQVNVGTAKCNVEQSSCSVVKPRYSFPNSLLLGVLNSFLRCVRPLCHCWCPPFSAGHVAFLFICLPGLSTACVRHAAFLSAGHVVYCLVSYSSVSQVCHCWRPPFSAGPCSISIHLSPRSVPAGVRPFPLAM